MVILCVSLLFKRYSSRDSPQVLLGCWLLMTPGSRNYNLKYSCREDPRNAGTVVNWQIYGNRDISASSFYRVSSRCRTRIWKYYEKKWGNRYKKIFFEKQVGVKSLFTNIYVWWWFVLTRFSLSVFKES